MSENDEFTKDSFFVMICDAGRKNRQRWYELGDSLANPVRIENTFLMTKKRNAPDMIKRARPGSVWQAPINEDGTVIRTGEGKYVGQYHDSEMVKKFWALHRANQLQLRMQTEATQAINDDKLQRALDPIREAYGDMSWQKRQALLAYVIEYITRG